MDMGGFDDYPPPPPGPEGDRDQTVLEHQQGEQQNGEQQLQQRMDGGMDYDGHEGMREEPPLEVER